jgi:hypothetical protein
MLKKTILPVFGVLTAAAAGSLLISALLLSPTVLSRNIPALPVKIVPEAAARTNAPKVRIDTYKPARRNMRRA